MAPRPDPEHQNRDRAEILQEVLTSERPALIAQARAHSHRREDADDALSDAAVQFLRYYDGPSGRDAIRWMMFVTKRCAWEIAKRTRRSERRTAIVPLEFDSDPIDALPAVGPDPADRAERGEEVGMIAAKIRELKPDERTALVLLGLGYSYREIAAGQGWTYTKVKRCVFEGRARLRELLARGGSS